MKRDPDDPAGRPDQGRQLEDLFRRDMRLSLAEAPSFDDLAAYVEGRLDPEARARLEERMDSDPTLRQEMEDLRGLHAQMARPRAVAPRPRHALIVTLSAAAAVLVLAVAVWRRPEGVALPGTASIPPAPVVVATVTDGDGRLRLLADGTLEGLPSLDPRTRDAVAGALRGVLPPPRGLQGLSAGQGRLLGTEPETASFGPISPVGTRVLSGRPTLRWTALPGARAYEVAVFDRDLRAQASSGPVTGTEWTPRTPLARGGTYLWQVTALTAAGRVTAPVPPAPEARFEVAGAALVAEIDTRRAEAPRSHLVATVALVEAGLLDDAEAERAALAVENPDSPEVARLGQALGRLRGPKPPAR